LAPAEYGRRPLHLRHTSAIAPIVLQYSVALFAVLPPGITTGLTDDLNNFTF